MGLRECTFNEHVRLNYLVRHVRLCTDLCLKYIDICSGIIVVFSFMYFL